MIYRCVNCGGNVLYDPQSGSMKCQSCGGTDCEENIESETPFVCPACGTAVTYRNEYGSATRCPSCGLYIIRDDYVKYPYGADTVIPFKLSRIDAEEKLKEEFGKKLFMPGDFLSAKTLEELRGVYVPFWLYDYDSNVDYHAVGTKVRTWVSGDMRYTETSYFDVFRKLHINYDDIPVDASEEMSDVIMDLMEPYKYDQMEKHNNKYMSGFEAEIYNFTPEQLSGRAEAKANNYSKKWAHDDVKMYTTLTNERINANNNCKENKFALLPVWIYEYRYKGQSYTFYVNGQTGKCVGTPPKDMGRAVGLTALLGFSIFAALSGLVMLLGVII